MPPPLDARVDAIFSEALELPDDERADFLDVRCASDPGIRAAVDELLRLAILSAPALDPGVLASGPLLRSALAETARGAESLSPGQEVGAWRVVREIGHGGMATVYLVERTDAQFAQQGALKLVRSFASSDEITRRFRRERRILASLAHPHIAKLLDGGQTTEGRPYFVMEYVEGRPLDRFCDEQRLTVAERIDLFMRVCGAVQYAHRRLVVHRDVKPANILVTRDGEVRLLDFGIARLLSPDEAGDEGPLTRPMTLVLTPEYASPEQVLGQPVAIASDVYQLGLVLYDLLTGERAQPVSEHTPHALAQTVCDIEPARPSARAAVGSTEAAAARRSTPAALARSLRSDLDSIVSRAIRKEPERRYASVGELLDDLGRYRAGLPVQARHDQWTYRAGKFVKRHRVVLGWAGTACLAGALVLPAWLGERWRAAREAARAEQVERLLEDLFVFPHPRIQPEPPSAATYLGHAAALVRTELDGQPRSQGRLLTQLGRVYNALGHYEASLVALEQALAVRRAQHGSESLEVADTLEWLGQSQHYLGRYDRAEASLREALAIRQLRQAPGDPDTIRTAIELGDLLHTRGRLVEAETVLRGTVAALRTGDVAARPGDLGHDSLPRALRDLANVLRDRGVLDEAAALYREAIELFRQLQGADGQQVATSQIYFARLLVMRSELPLAEVTLADSLGSLRRIYDGEHALVGIAMRNLAYLRIEQGRLTEADHLLGEAQRIQREWLGQDHPMVARAAVHQAELARRRGHLEEAVAVSRRARDAFERLGMGEHPAAIDARATLGQALAAFGDREAAARELSAALDAAERQLVAGDQRILTLRSALRRILE
jgi:eukaryotic-like serine/threonine-protein kinase